MPDPLTALSLASSIAQLVEFVRDVVSDGRQIAKLGSTSETEHIRTIVNDVGNLSAKVVKTCHPRPGAHNQDENALHELGQESCNAATELAHLLEGLRIHESENTRKRKRDIAMLSFKTMLNNGDVQKLQKRLESLQRQLHLRLTFMMSMNRIERTLRHQVINPLSFAEINTREDAIAASYGETYDWVFSEATTGFKTWASFGSGLFWVTGKPGSGKSTLMKYLSNQKRTRNLLELWAGTDKLIIATHYFWIAGTATQKSQSGLLRSLLFQILEECPDIIPLVAPQRILEKDPVQRPWNMSELTETMRRVGDLQGVPIKICIFVDGLDEYEGEHSEIVQLLSDLGKRSRIKMLVSSRPWNVFTKAFGFLPSKTIVMQDLTHGDIRTYVEGNLMSDEYFRRFEDRDSTGADLITDITAKSQGVFLWVFLVVRSLLRGLTNGDNLDILRQRVAEYPDSLDGYFDRMMKSTEKVYHMQMARLLLVAVHSEGGLPLQLVDNIHTETKDVDYDIRLPVWHTAPTREQDDHEAVRTKKLLDARCRDLLEVVGTQIHFLHRTVKDFLTTREMYSMLLERAGPSFDPGFSLAKNALAVVKAHSCLDGSDLSMLLLYERETASRTWPSNPYFLQTLTTLMELGSFHEAREKGHAFLVHMARAEDIQDWLNVTGSQDWLISVEEDFTTTIGDKGSPFVQSAFVTTFHAWIGDESTDVLDRMMLIQKWDLRGTHVLVARFRDGETGLYERQRAFVRIAQAFFARAPKRAHVFPTSRLQERPRRAENTSSWSVVDGCFGKIPSHFQKRK